MRKNVTREIRGFSYVVMQLGAGKGREVMLRLAKVTGPAIGAILAAVPGGKLQNILDADVTALGPAVGKIFESLSAQDLAFFCQTFGETTLVYLEENKHPRVIDVFDEHFAGNYLAMLQWLAFAVEVNFSDFFEGAAKPSSDAATS